MAIFHEVRCQNFWKGPLTNQIADWGAKQGYSFTGVWKQIKQNCQWKRSRYPSQTRQPIPRCARPLSSHLLTQRLTWPHVILFFLPRSFGARPLLWPGSPWSAKLRLLLLLGCQMVQQGLQPPRGLAKALSGAHPHPQKLVQVIAVKRSSPVRVWSRACRLESDNRQQC